MNRNLASARNVASATGPIPPYSTVAYIIMQFCHFCGMHSFVSGPLFQFAALQQHTNCPAGRAPVRAVSAAALPAPATSRGAVRPSSPPAQTAASFKLAVVAVASADTCCCSPGGSAPDLAAGAGSCKLQVGGGGGGGGGGGRSRSSPPEAPSGGRLTFT